MQKNNIVLGAGPAGLFCGHELKKLGHAPLIIEKQDHLGGLAATHQLGAAGFEVGPHIFQANDAYIYQIAKDYLGEDLLYKDWKVQQYLGDQLFTFPNELSNMWSLLGTAKMIEFILSFLKYRFLKPQDFRSFIYKKVGKALAEFNVINYTEKMWGLGIDELEYEWIKPRMDRISIWKIIRTIFESHQRSFYYPRAGAGQLYDLMGASQNVQFNEYPIAIKHNQGLIELVQTNRDQYSVEGLFSSIPIGELVHLLSPQAPESVLNAVNALRYRSQIYVALLLDQAKVVESQWIYFPEKSIPFCRVHSPGMFSPGMEPQGQSVLVFEYFCFTEDPIWEQQDEAIIEMTFSALQKVKIKAGISLLDATVLRKEKAYPLLDKQRLKNLAQVESYLAEFKNLYSMGRHGLHTYDNQHEAGRTGVDVAQKWKNNL